MPSVAECCKIFIMVNVTLSIPNRSIATSFTDTRAIMSWTYSSLFDQVVYALLARCFK